MKLPMFNVIKESHTIGQAIAMKLDQPKISEKTINKIRNKIENVEANYGKTFPSRRNVIVAQKRMIEVGTANEATRSQHLNTLISHLTNIKTEVIGDRKGVVADKLSELLDEKITSLLEYDRIAHASN